ncbi:MAG: type III-B CRISPR-associated protein Cas10/Cmr2 [Synechococcaceae cyanobacterium]|nr:type III-B CRISPR-associated protein Cas10/Cmr2 [Synechococcaceae cyanobacterium]
MTYTAVTFAPVQSFIRASRKLRDLYGSSLLLSHLARAVAVDAEAKGHAVISPASISSSRGVPNVLVIKGNYRKDQARDALLASWKKVLHVCRQWLEKAMPETAFDWDSSWRACGLHTWELFHGQGESIERAREALAVSKQQRDWSAPNWTGESSTLSSAEAVVWPQMGAVRDPRELPPGQVTQQARAFLETLREHEDLGEAFAGMNEEISLTELVKRLVTYPAVAGRAFATEHDPTPALKDLLPDRFRELSLISKERETEREKQSESIVWFMADGDGIGDHLQSLKEQGEEEALRSFSKAMRDWASRLYGSVPAVMQQQAMVVYAGGDDLFGALHETTPGAKDLSTKQLWDWLRQFPAIWRECGQDNLTVSMGLVWADAMVHQREALQHAREAEASAKALGKNRFALRLLYANGNHLEWSCPWPWLEPILSRYRDREGRQKWRHLAEDLQWLKGRQAIAQSRGNCRSDAQATARALWSAYFPGLELPPEPPGNPPGDGGTARFRATAHQPEKDRVFDQWLLNLGQVMAGLEKHQPRRAEQQGAQP